MILGLASRLVGLAFLILVTYAAVTVPIGRRTTYGHLVAIFTTDPAREAAEDLKNTGVQLGTRLLAQRGSEGLHPAASSRPANGFSPVSSALPSTSVAPPPARTTRAHR